MNFEEQFPSFEKDSILVRLGVGLLYKDEVMEKCLDKAKVKKTQEELLEKAGNRMSQQRQDLKWAFDILNKELGLKDNIFGMKIKEDKSLKDNEFKLE